MGREECTHTYFSKRFKAIREASSLSIYSLGEKSKINRATIYRYESGESIPNTLSIWISLAKAHGMSLPQYMDALFGIKNIQPDGKRLDDEVSERDIQPDIKRLDDMVSRLEAVMKKCPLMGDTS